ncbi:hypothetical protein [Frigoribacterium sp. CG_9.8]|uniref:hypothetical protein n=1 Tax=Frigoribacterium sp. CG_9.8 TaxID=2787733 RepID=UPI0018CAFE04|nr:hypothetical protein [Frigoribacterium sp. CG_9.8]MBG6108429.1 hypothetical protein [Frigoribacterium sp. CG_9.8]
MTSAAIEDLLQQSGIDDQALLRELLGEIEALGAGDAPVPSAEVLALMAPSTGVVRRRFQSRRRTAIVITLAVTASVGMGTAAAAAAIPEVRRVAQNVIQTVMHAVAPHVTMTTSPAGVPSRSDNHAAATHSSDSDGEGRSATTPSISAPKSTTAPSSPPKASVVPANPHATDAPVVPPTQIPAGKSSPPPEAHGR